MSQDVQILPFEVANAPNSWTIPDALTIMLKAINATFNGTGAAGAFLPAVEIISDSGHVAARVFTDTAVAAGDSAEVTFAPFLRNAAGNACGGKIDSTQQVGNTCGVHSVGQGSGRVLTSDGADGSRWLTPTAVHSQTAYENVATFPATQAVGAGATTALTLAHVSQSLLLDFTAPATPKFKTAGVYALTVSVVADGGVTTRNHFQMQLIPTGAAIGTATYAQDVHSNVLADATIGTVSWTAPLLANDTFQLQILNNDTVGRGFTVFFMAVTRVLVAF